MGSLGGMKQGGLPWEASSLVALLSLGTQLHLCKQLAFSPAMPGMWRRSAMFSPLFSRRQWLWITFI